MRIIAGTNDFQLHTHTAVAIGKFDGVHIGHQVILQEILNQKERGLEALVFTFDPPPAVLFGFSDGMELSTREQKRALFEQMGIDVLVEFPLTRETAAISPEAFIKEVLVGRLQASFVAAGTDVSYGDKGRGDLHLLQRMGLDLGFEVKAIEKVFTQLDPDTNPDESPVEISSTLLRELVSAGKMEQAAKLLGNPYCIAGEIVHGNHLGHSLGFPTINVHPQESKLLPPFGVYASRVHIDGMVYKGISNIGCKPTVTQEKKVGIETYLYDFDKDVYGKETEIELLSFRRPEKRFESLDALKAQLAQDIEACR